VTVTVPVRIGVTQRVHALEGRDERRDVLDQRWTSWLAPAIAVPIPNRLADPAGYVADLGLAGLVLTGGNDLAHLASASDPAPERDRTEQALLDHAAMVGLPVLAVCRGMQMLVHCWGGTLTRVEHHVARDHELRIVDDRWPLRAGPVNSYHDWGVPPDGVGPELLVLASAPDGTVEAVAHPSLPQVGVMWHPERPIADPADRALLDALVRGR
jgi:gamma-glutamyl-gamma-aminobutyrate hydrolase PuuD